jgi:DNA-binding MarR family transcriptional regulator
MDADERRDLADALLEVAGTLVGISIRGVAAGPVELTLVQHRVLVLIDRAGQASVTDVADQLGVNQSNASRHCGRLVDLGLVTRERASHDARTVELRLTPSGRRQVGAVRAARLEEIRSVLAQLEIANAGSVIDALRAFDRSAGAATLAGASVE